ncbi:MAG: hypothetical protein Athens041674_409 [Parcubacteria group bacterium Athens0416_74]|nr:MAG: hypothetical protein Athens041674_409 [Parcubacteria group bacterium Athens0416_74]
MRCYACPIVVRQPADRPLSSYPHVRGPHALRNTSALRFLSAALSVIRTALHTIHPARWHATRKDICKDKLNSRSVPWACNDGGVKAPPFYNAVHKRKASQSFDCEAEGGGLVGRQSAAFAAQSSVGHFITSFHPRTGARWAKD